MAKVKSSDRPQRLQGKPLAAPDRPHFKRSPMAGFATDEPIVLDDLPEMIPITGPELDAIETYLGNLIYRLLVDAGSDRAVTPLPPPIQGCPSGPPALDRD